MSANRNRCFVIMPFTNTSDEHTEDYWTKHFKNFLKPIIEENQTLEAHRSGALRGDILKQIITDLVTSPVVVADITDDNPNVYWELGVRQSFKHGTITIAEEGTIIPFDIEKKGVLFYCHDHIKNEDFRTSFKAAIEDCLSHPERCDSHVLETLSGRGTFFEIFRRDETIRRLDAILSEWRRNSVGLEAVIKIAKNNQKNPAERIVETERFGVSSIELLVTNRYVDENKSFFELAERCLVAAISLNNMLSFWASDLDRVEKWLINKEEYHTKIFNEFIAKVGAAREKIMNMS